mmetsp:Transcript_26748/g.63795  ORF Transcript_26748/g.63795 Transcript_26748/m.63795 type:complete len:670 (-) Transcript_26748:1516-3525(-)
MTSTTTAWDSIEDDYRSYLETAGINREAFNECSLLDKVSLLKSFEERESRKRGINDGTENRTVRQRLALLSDGTPLEEAEEVFRDFLQENVAVNEMKPSDFCYPSTMEKTWNEDNIRKKLREHSDICYENIRTFSDRRAPVVILVRQGLGNGKTHTLVQAPRLLGTNDSPWPSNYVTYNGDQCVSFDKTNPRQSLLLRLFSNALGYGNITASNVLSQPDVQEMLSVLSLSYLRTLVAKAISHNNNDRVCVCVDELRKLVVYKKDEDGGFIMVNKAVEEVLSELGYLSDYLHRNHSLKCTNIVTALSKATVKTTSERALLPLALNTEQTAIDFIARAMNVTDQDNVRWKLHAVAGNHMRSIVVACDLMTKGSSYVELASLFKKVYERLASPLYNHDPISIVNYVKESCLYGGCGKVDSLPEDSEIVLDNQNGVPPAIMLACFPEESQDRKEILSIFENTIYRDAPKQLEKTGSHYDLLRSHWGLPVIPIGMKVYREGGASVTTHFRDFVFPVFSSGVTFDKDLFKIAGKKVVWAGLSPQLGEYYHPSTTNHPWVDRFFLAKREDSSLYLVLYQDKINAEGFTDAVKKINLAVNMIKENLPTYKVLCILNVIGASSQTKKQSDLVAPYVLVRNDEIERFYTVHFAPAIRFLRQRFLDEGKVKTSVDQSVLS